MLEIVYFIFIGGVAGVLAGLLGLGGGLVVVPLLAVMLGHLGFPSEEVMHVAVATSLGTIVLTSLSSAYAHHKRDAVQWRLVWLLGAGLMIGAFSASYIVDLLANTLLEIIFIIYVLIVAYQLYFRLEAKALRDLPKQGQLVGLGGIFGMVSGLLGIGGGTMIVPFLVWCNVTMHKAVATSSACGFFIALGAVTGFVSFAEPHVVLPDGSLGYLYLPALFTIGLVSVACAPLGAAWAHRVSTEKLKRYFSFVLLIMAGMLLLN